MPPTFSFDVFRYPTGYTLFSFMRDRLPLAITGLTSMITVTKAG